MLSPLIVLPTGNGPGNIGILSPLIAAAQQQYNRFTCLRVIDSVARADINPQLPDAIPTKPVIAKVPKDYAIDTALNRNTCSHVTQTVEPILKEITALSG
jgi:hypothetical protein